MVWYKKQNNLTSTIFVCFCNIEILTEYKRLIEMSTPMQVIKWSAAITYH